MEHNSEKQFDDFIKGSMENIQASYDPESWNLLEQRMDQMDGREIDAAARQALTNYSVPYNPATWQLLSERLESLDYRRKLIALKVVEAALILLVLLTAVRFVRQMPATQKDEFPQTEERQQMASNASPARSMDIASTSKQLQTLDAMNGSASELNSAPFMEKSTATTSRNQEILASKVSSSSIVKEQKPKSFREEQSLRRVAHPAALTALSTKEHTVASLVKLTLTHAWSTQELAGRTRFDVQNIGSRDLAVAQARTPIRSALSAELSGLPTIDVRTIMHEDIAISLASAAPKLKKTRALTTKIGLFQQSVDHKISFDILRNRSKKVQQVNNGAFGIATTVQSNRLGFDFGLAYEGLTFFTGSFDDNAQETTMEVKKVQLPLNLRFIPVTNRYFDVYVKGGVTAHGVLLANYEPPYATARGVVRTDSEYGEKYNDGLLKKEGLLHNNSYYSINYGVGAEIKAFQDWSIFIEGMLQKHHSGELGQGQGIKISSRMLTVGINRTL